MTSANPKRRFYQTRSSRRRCQGIYPRRPADRQHHRSDGPITIARGPTLGLAWLGASLATLTPTAIYSGPLPDIGPVTLFNIPTTAGFPPGTYQWFLIVHDPATAIVTTDVVATTLQ